MGTSQLVPELLKPSHLLSYPPPSPWGDGLWDTIHSCLPPPAALAHFSLPSASQCGALRLHCRPLFHCGREMLGAKGPGLASRFKQRLKAVLGITSV